MGVGCATEEHMSKHQVWLALQHWVKVEEPLNGQVQLEVGWGDRRSSPHGAPAPSLYR